jgi:uncharacterized protein
MAPLFISYFLYFGVGTLAGIAGGMLGIGGGTITVPALFIIFKWIGLPQSYVMQLAIGTSLAAMVINTCSAARAHHLKNAVMWNIVKRMLPGVAIGSMLGGLTAHYVSGIVLEIIFGIFALTLGIHYLKPLNPHVKERALPGFPLVDFFSSLIAWISNILGIGGGVLLVPFLNAYRIHAKKAIGTSVAISIFISSFGALFYLFFGLQDVGFGISFGYIYLPAFFLLSIGSYFAAPYGAMLAHSMPSNTLRKIYAFAMILVGSLMIFG